MSSFGKTVLAILGVLLVGLVIWLAFQFGVLAIISKHSKEIAKEHRVNMEVHKPERLRRKITWHLSHGDFSKARAIAGSDEDAFVDCVASILTKEYEKNGAGGVYELLVTAALTPGSGAEIRLKASVRTLRQFAISKGDIIGARTLDKYLENE